MIPHDFITEWRYYAPWALDAQVEQDLIVSRTLVAMFGHSDIAKTLAFRGGTALYKLYLQPTRYSEDIDLVQVASGSIGPTLNALRSVLDPWLGAPKRSFKEGRVTLIYRVQSEDVSPLPLRLKVEINSREHFSVFSLEERVFEVSSRWFSGVASVQTYHLDELLGTKLRALYQRKKGRDLFDLWNALRTTGVNPDRIIASFLHYMKQGSLRFSRAEFEANLVAKFKDPHFTEDIYPLLAPGIAWDLNNAAVMVQERLISRLPGEPWKGKGWFSSHFPPSADSPPAFTPGS